MMTTGQIAPLGCYAKTMHFTANRAILCGDNTAFYASTDKAEVTCGNCLKRLAKGQAAKLSQAEARAARKLKEAEGEAKLKAEMGW